MKERKITIQTEDNFRLGATVKEPDGNPKGCIQINSGTGIPQRFYKNFANYCAEQGFVTITYDYRGIGDSKPEKLKGFEAYNHQWGTLDMTAVLNWSINHYPALEKIVIGHSMGGQIIGLMKNADRIDRVVMIASGVGYWREMPKGSLKNFMPFLWYVYMPLSIWLYGYVNAQKIKQGENLPKGVGLEWKKWCTNKNYWEVDFGKTIDPNSFKKMKAPILSFNFPDDNIISRKANQQLLSYYTNAKITKKEILPKDAGVDKIGHFGFFSEKSKSLWKGIL